MENKPHNQVLKPEKPKERLAKVITAAFFGMTLIEIIAEYMQHPLAIRWSKPFLMPLLLLLYFVTSKTRSRLYMVSLVFVWLGNLFLIGKTFDDLVIGAIFFTLFRILMIYHLLRTVRLPGVLPMVIGCLPFLFLYLFAINLAYDDLGENFYVFAFQGLFPIIFGGIALGAYMFKSNKSNTFLLISMIFFTSTQFLFIIKYFYVSITIFQPVLMLLFINAHYGLYKFMIAEEDLRHKKSKMKNFQDKKIIHKEY